MESVCRTCGCSEALTLANAQALGLEQEFRSAVYDCCQLAEWADEQWTAWFIATHEDGQTRDALTSGPQLDVEEASLVPVRLRRPQVPWFKYPGNWRE